MKMEGGELWRILSYPGFYPNIRKKKKSVEHCQRFYTDYGAGGITVSGAGRARLYNDLPECEALYDAEKGSSKR